jgi:serine/threonine protein kinase
VHVLLPAQACILDGLESLHRQRWAHRDVKPHNLLVNKDGNIVLADLGLACGMGEDGLLLAGIGAGTRGFAAPEVSSLLRECCALIDHTSKRSRYAGVPADVFSTGATLFYMLTGQVPQARRRKQRWADKLAGAFSSRQQQQQPAVGSKVSFPSHLGLSPEVVQLVGSMMERRPERRPTLQQVRSHAWFAGFDWAAFKAGSMAPPHWARMAAEYFTGVPLA